MVLSILSDAPQARGSESVIQLVRLSLVLAVIGWSAATVAAQQPDPRRDPAAAIKEMLRLAEANDYVTLLKTFARPADLETMLKKGTIEELAANFQKGRGADFIAALKTAAAMKPAMSEDGLRARYQFDKRIGNDMSMELWKVGEFWYLK